MVETIAPVVYGRRSRHYLAVVIHSLSASVAGAAFGGVLALLGQMIGSPWGNGGLWLVAAVAALYSLRELFGLPVPLMDRRQQVPDWWRTFYSPPVAAGLYGAGLGIGFLTFLRFGTYVAVCVAALASGQLLVGAAFGATFGLARGLTALAAARTTDEEGAAHVVVKLQSIAVTRGPRLVNGLMCVALAVVALLATSCAPEPRGSLTEVSALREYRGPRVIGKLRDPKLTESSGLAASRAHPGILWTHNDSGDAPFVYCLTRTGRSCGTWEVLDARAFDWEDIALGPGPDTGTSYLYVGDIGDNLSARDSVVVYRIEEPDPGTDDGGPVTSEALVLTYPDGPHDAEALLVHPVTGDIYVVTKASSGRAGVYRADLGAGSLDRVARIEVPGAWGGVTGGDISPTGDLVALSTYSGAVELALADGAEFDSIWRAEPRAVDIGSRSQGESITYSADGSSLIASSEGRGAPIYEIRSRRP